MLLAAGAPPLGVSPPRPDGRARRPSGLSKGWLNGDDGSAPAERRPSIPTIDALAVDWSDVTMLEKIGSGAFGDIWKCRWRGTLVAAKMLKGGLPR